MKRIMSFGLVLLSFFPNVVNAQQILVESTKINEDKIEPSRSSTVITSDDIKLQKANTIAEVLNTIPGIEVVKTGAVGQTTSVFIRGARSEDTLVLIDGMDANDAMSPGCGFDFSSMSSENIERIEVYRGPQSVRFGAGALGGVINIITKVGVGKAVVNYLAEAGSYGTNRQVLSTNGKINNLGYSLGVNRYSTEGFSAAGTKYGATEKDGAEIGALSGKLVWNLSKTASIQTTFRYANADVEIDAFGGPGGDDPNNKNQSKQLVTGITAAERFLGDRLKSYIGLYFSEVDRSGRNKADSINSTNSSDLFKSENRKIQSENELMLGEYSTIRLGLQWRDESGHASSISGGNLQTIDRKNQSIYGGSLTYLFESETWFFDVGARSDYSSTVNSVNSIRSSLGSKFTDYGTKAYISYSTGYKLPSLYQLYSAYGNQDLKFEDSDTVEITVEQKIGDVSHLTLVGFDNRYKNYIDYDPSQTPGRYLNISKATSRGFELQASTNITESLKLSGNYTYLDAKDESTGLKLLRRPQSSWMVSSNYTNDALELYAQYSYRGQRDDYDPTTFIRIENPAYDLINLGGSYTFNKYLKVFARFENVFNRKYEEVAGYGTPGRSIFVGISGEL